MKSPVKTKIIARLYAVTVRDSVRELQVASAGDLAEQLALAGVDDTSAKRLARLAWDDVESDISLRDVQIYAVGQVIQQFWRRPPAVRSKGPKEAAPVNQAALPADDAAIPLFDQLGLTRSAAEDFAHAEPELRQDV